MKVGIMNYKIVWYYFKYIDHQRLQWHKMPTARGDVR